MTVDPFVELGLTRSASIAEVRAARRRLARDAHPDVGGDPDRMQRINAAFDAAVGHLTGRRPLPSEPTVTPPGSSPSPGSMAPRRGAIGHGCSQVGSWTTTLRRS
ncbi:MAG: hypothetical protein R2715_09335 [Ilumatobacteraceae bacterium]